MVACTAWHAFILDIIWPFPWDVSVPVITPVGSARRQSVVDLSWRGIGTDPPSAR